MCIPMNFDKISQYFRRNSHEIAAYLVCEILCILLLVWIMRLWEADLAVPFSYVGDALAMDSLVKGIIDNIWWTQNSFLGMPFGQVHFDRPFLDTFDLLIMKMIGLITGNFAIAINLFYLLTFPLTALTTLFVFRQLKISIVPSIVGSLIYTFIPFHFLRGEEHIFYSSYFLIPLVMLVLIWIYQGKPVLYNAEKNSLELSNSYTLASLIICALLAFQNVYYLFFSCFFFLVIGVFHTLSTRERKYLISCSLLIGFMVVLLLINSAPIHLYHTQNESNSVAVTRYPLESEMYGLKITQMILPMQGHRIPVLANITRNYVRTAPNVNENSFATLGAFGSLGFLVLLFWIFYRIGESGNKSCLTEIRPMLDWLATLNLSAVLLATMGGFGVAFAYYTSFSYIRGYNRISIIIAFFAILTVILLLDYIRQHWCVTLNRRYLFTILLCVLLIGAVLDQTKPAFAPNYESVKGQFLTDQKFIQKIEAQLPEDSMIFQLPYLPYPEYGPINKMGDYTPAIAYLHSEKLRWSYGSLKGSPEANWNKKIVQQNISPMVNSLSFAGFNGIYVDTYGYEDGGEQMISTLSSTLKTTPVISDDKREYFFDMTEYNRKLQSQYTPEEYAKAREAILSQ